MNKINKKVLTLVGIMAFLAVPLKAADKHSNSEFCLKHCTAVQLGSEVNALEKSIGELKAGIAKGDSATKLATVNARNEAAHKHIAQHEAEIASLKTRLASLETELAQMEAK